MASIRRLVETSFWTDPEVIDTYSVEDKYFLLYLMTNPATTQVGIYQLSKKVMSFESGYSIDVINVLIDRFQNKYRCIIYNHETHEVSLINSLTYTIIKGGRPVSDLLQRELSRIRDSDIIYQTYSHMLEFWHKSDRQFDKTIQLLFEQELIKRGHSGITPNDIQSEIDNANQIEKDKHNDMRMMNEKNNEDDNEESYAESVSESPLERIKHYYTQQLGVLSDSEIKLIKSWLAYLSPEKIIEALEKSKKASAPVLYAHAIVKNWI